VNEQTKLDIDAAIPAAICDECGKAFTPRTGGGSKQRFCCDTCRKRHHKMGDAQGDAGDAEPVKPTPAEDSEFDWNDDCVVLREQRETAIYWNPAGDLVIRQRAGRHDYDDPFLVIRADNIADFIDRLTDIIGIPSVGRHD
jgi:hypothetical protein